MKSCELEAKLVDHVLSIGSFFRSNEKHMCTPHVLISHHLQEVCWLGYVMTVVNYCQQTACAAICCSIVKLELTFDNSALLSFLEFWREEEK